MILVRDEHALLEVIKVFKDVIMIGLKAQQSPVNIAGSVLNLVV